MHEYISLVFGIVLFDLSKIVSQQKPRRQYFAASLGGTPVHCADSFVDALVESVSGPASDDAPDDLTFFIQVNGHFNCRGYVVEVSSSGVFGLNAPIWNR